MKPWYPLYFLYQWLIAMPLIIVATLLTAIFTLILAPIFPNNKISNYPAILWSKFSSYILFIRIKVSGLENIDKNQSYVFTPNHQSLFDIFAVYACLPVIFKWMMKIELRKVPMVGAACEAAGHVFVDRANPVVAKKSLLAAANTLKEGVSVVIFPEGTRTKTGQVNRFKRGAFLLALELNLPIIPITLKGSFERAKGFLFFPGKIEMIVHPAINMDNYSIEESSKLIRDTQEVIKSAL